MIFKLTWSLQSICKLIIEDNVSRISFYDRMVAETKVKTFCIHIILDFDGHNVIDLIVAHLNCSKLILITNKAS